MNSNKKIEKEQIENLLQEIELLKKENLKLRNVYSETIISEKTFKDLFDSTSDAIYIQDKNGLFITVNHGAELMYGYPREYFVGKSPEFLSAPNMNNLEEVVQMHQKAIKGEDQRFEFWGISKSGRIFPKSVKMMKGFYKNEDVVIVTAQDITEKKIASESIKKTSNTLKAIFESSPDGIVIIENDDITIVNKRFTEITGLTLRDLKTRKLESIVHPDDKIIIKESLKKSLEKKELPKELIYRVKLDTGEEKTLKNRYSFLERNKETKDRLVIISDITEQMKNENALLDSKCKLNGIFENSLDGIGVSRNGKHVLCNPAFIKIFGYDSFEEIEGRDELELLIPEERERIRKYTIDREDNNKAPQIYNTIGLRKNGSTLDVEIKVSNYEFKGDVYQIAFVRDITESNRLTKELIASKNRAEKADNLKSEFLAQISHEIRTPINAILSFASLIKEDVKDKIEDDIFDSFDIMNKAGNRLIRTIDLILNMSELQTDSYEMNIRSINVNNEILDIIVREKRKNALKKKITFITKFEDELIINGDENSIYQIFENIIDNAVKYTEKGSVQVITKIENEQKIVEIIDTGIGISDNYLKELFQPFSQEEQGYCRKFEGNGLGLALVKKYCEMNDADIEVESKKGVGTKFKVTFK